MPDPTACSVNEVLETSRAARERVVREQEERIKTLEARVLSLEEDKRAAISAIRILVEALERLCFRASHYGDQLTRFTEFAWLRTDMGRDAVWGRSEQVKAAKILNDRNEARARS